MIPAARKRRMLFSFARFAIAAVLVTICFAVGKGAWNMYGTMSRAKAEATETRKRHDELVRRKEDVHASLYNLETEYGSEAALRERFGVARPGEIVILLTDIEAPAGATTTPSEEESGDGWFW
jgi:cell division protein FtsB